ncbi:MAG: hypothetical protein LJE96_03355, partial [Deltaproteobacteria bacterium]|nr:hypothetical protein [Deltaproteobacteria bacterium]
TNKLSTLRRTVMNVKLYCPSVQLFFVRRRIRFYILQGTLCQDLFLENGKEIVSKTYSKDTFLINPKNV